MIIFVIRAYRVLVGIMLAQVADVGSSLHQHWAIWYRVISGSGLFGVGVRKRHPYCYAAVPQQTRDTHLGEIALMLQVNIVITQSLGSNEFNRVISESCYTKKSTRKPQTDE